MHKIYSRRRIRIPKIIINTKKRLRTNKVKNKLNISIIIIIAFCTVAVILNSVLPIFDILCENEAKSIATIISNEEATNVMREHTYDELFTIEKDKDGNITMIESNIVPINEIISDVAVKIQNRINETGREDIEIALGSFTGFKLLSGKGPGVDIRISSVGSVETDLRSEFTSQGINQTLHRVYLQVKCKVNILTPFDNIEREITNQVLLVENVIVGGIPNTYYNLEGLNSAEDSLEVWE